VKFLLVVLCEKINNTGTLHE